MSKKIILFVMAALILLTYAAYADADSPLEGAQDSIDTDDIEGYIRSNSDYYGLGSIDLSKIIKDAFNGKIDVDIKDYIRYIIGSEGDFFKGCLRTCINILVVCLLLVVLNYFSDEIGNQSVSDIVVFFSVIIIFSIIVKDVNSVKDMLRLNFDKFKTITEDMNGLFLAAMLTFGKLSLLQFFQSYMNYIIGITTKFIYGFSDIMTVVLIAVILINNTGKLVNMKLLFKFLKKGTLLILSAYIIIVVINFSVQGYILYKTDNIFITSVKALSPESIPVIGNAVNSFFGVFLKSILLIKDVLGVVMLIFIFSAFGSSLLRMFIVFIMYKATAVIAEPLSAGLSKLIYEMADIFYIYLVCMLTPIVIVTVYYSVLLNYLNNIFG